MQLFVCPRAPNIVGQIKLALLDKFSLDFHKFCDGYCQFVYFLNVFSLVALPDLNQNHKMWILKKY